MLSTSKLMEQVGQRGPRYAVTATVRRGEHILIWSSTSDDAERLADKEREAGNYAIKVYPPEDANPDLELLGRNRSDAKRAYDDSTAILRAGVLRALESGRAEAEVARAAGVDRMTVRDWAGKR